MGDARRAVLAPTALNRADLVTAPDGNRHLFSVFENQDIIRGMDTHAPLVRSRREEPALVGHFSSQVGGVEEDQPRCGDRFFKVQSRRLINPGGDPVDFERDTPGNAGPDRGMLPGFEKLPRKACCAQCFK